MGGEQTHPQDDEGKGARLPPSSRIGTHPTTMYMGNRGALERLGVGALGHIQELGVHARILGKPRLLHLLKAKDIKQRNSGHS